MAKPGNPETAVQKDIADAISAHGLWVVRVPVQGIKQGRITKKSPMKGFPDFLVIGPEGSCAWLEVKTATGQVEPHQAEILDRLASCGHVSAVVRSVDQAIAVLFHAGMITRSTGH